MCVYTHGYSTVPGTSGYRLFGSNTFYRLIGNYNTNLERRVVSRRGTARTSSAAAASLAYTRIVRALYSYTRA